MRPYYFAWSTAHELEFLNNLGHQAGHRNPIGYKEHLQRYIESCAKRVNWRGIDKDAVIEHANALLKILES